MKKADFRVPVGLFCGLLLLMKIMVHPIMIYINGNHNRIIMSVPHPFCLLFPIYLSEHKSGFTIPRKSYQNYLTMLGFQYMLSLVSPSCCVCRRMHASISDCFFFFWLSSANKILLVYRYSICFCFFPSS